MIISDSVLEYELDQLNDMIDAVDCCEYSSDALKCISIKFTDRVRLLERLGLIDSGVRKMFEDDFVHHMTQLAVSR